MENKMYPRISMLESAQKGTLALTMLFSTAAGVCFLMLMFNTVRYVSAASTVKEAARVAARCVSPIEGDCAEYARETSVEQELEWFGFEPGNRPTELWVDLFEYEARMRRVLWGASWNTYELQAAEQGVSWNTYSVPRYRYIPRLESVDRTYQASYQQSYFAPVSSPNFPRFTQDSTTPEESWNPQGFKFETAYRGAVPFRATSNDPRISLRVAVFESPVIPVPELPNSEEALCVGDCDVSALSGFSEEENNASRSTEVSTSSRWKESVSLAIKAFSTLERIGGNPSVFWGDERASGLQRDGLYIRIWDKDGNPLDWEEPTYGRGLGGFEWKRVSETAGNYNLWLRGPSKSHGGRSEDTHDRIRVPRGGSFQIVGKMSSRDGEVAATATINYYFDRYEEKTASLNCAETSTKGSPLQNESTVCNNVESCVANRLASSSSELPEEFFANLNGWKPIGACEETVSNPVALTKDEHAAVLATIPVLPEAAACSKTWQPDAKSVLLPSYLQVVGYDAELISRSEVADVPGGCATASVRRDRLDYCSSPVVVGSSLRFEEDCPNLKRTFEELAKRTEEVNSKQAVGAIKFPTQVSFRTAAQRTRADSLRAWVPLDRDGDRLSTSQYKPIKHSLARAVPLKVASYQLKPEFADKQEKPSGALFVDAIKEASGGAIGDRGWSEFVKGANSYVTPVALGQEEVKLKAAYPFKEPVPEIYYGQQDGTKSWDFNRDCSPDKECRGLPKEKRFSSEEEMLRNYASKEISEARDQRYFFSFASKWSGRKFYDLATLAEAQDFSSAKCLPTKMICHSASMGTERPISLGISKSEPEKCSSGEYVDCYSKPYGDAAYSFTDISEISEELVQQVAHREMQRVIPYAKHPLECGESEIDSCTRVSIEKTDDRKVQVEVSYNVPLTFPFRQMLGQDGLWVSSYKEEVLEWEAARD